MSELRRAEEALAAAGEAVEIRRRLAAARPDAFEPDLAMSLNNLGRMLSGAGRPEEAWVADAEAIEIRRRLAADGWPAFFEPDPGAAIGRPSRFTGREPVSPLIEGGCVGGRRGLTVSTGRESPVARGQVDDAAVAMDRLGLVQPGETHGGGWRPLACTC